MMEFIKGAVVGIFLLTLVLLIMLGLAWIGDAIFG